MKNKERKEIGKKDVECERRGGNGIKIEERMKKGIIG